MKLEARITSIVNRNKLKAYASVLIDNCFLVPNIRIIDGINGLFIAMPSRKKQNGEFEDICFPITADARKEIERAVLEAYKLKLEGIKNETIKV